MPKRKNQQVQETKQKKKKSKRMPACQHSVEIEYWYVLPAIRRELAKSLKELGSLRQKEVADILGISESAVSQYLKGTRAVLELENGEDIEMPEWLVEEITKASQSILDNREDHANFLWQVNHLMNVIRERPRAFLCKIHRTFGKTDENCTVCFHRDS